MSNINLVIAGRFCEELKGSRNDHGSNRTTFMRWLFFSRRCGPEEFTAKFEAAIGRIDDFLVFADLSGGTPCTQSRLIMESDATLNSTVG